jgi:N-acetylglucosaminyl-diphospho-decaprenol L-rhamnosyltransferase
MPESSAMAPSTFCTGVSIVIPHYGATQATLLLLNQLRDQLGARDEVIVVDDASPAPFPDTAGVIVLRRDKNGGFGAAVNTGAAVATGDLLLILNSDLEVGPTFVADFIAASASWQPAVTGPLILDHEGVPDFSARHFPTIAHQGVEWLTPLARFRDRQRLHKAVGHDTRAVPGVIIPVDWLVGAALLLPRQAFLDVGGFDERFHMNAEEVDLQRRLRADGIPSVFIGTVSVTHEGGGSSDPAKRRQWLVESRFRYAAKWGGEGRLRASLRAATAINLAANVVRRAAGNRAVDPLATARHEWSLTRGGRS